ncbi:unnamed protein product [Caenorhabditis angaria]|uniref:Uncharacterized protein n=1 Tax=Caenorhabditis angaria TaxID=860376 RepID=A0A9P1IBT4_9PELO|nr:unnamed protein product [Caenorhabditis angaria]
MLLRLFLPYFLPNFIFSFELHPKPEIRKCFSCSVFTFINSRLVCANPSTCEADYCYTYITSDARSIYLSGCAEDVSDFNIRGFDTQIKCHTRNAIGLCVCANTNAINSCQHIFPQDKNGPIRRNLTTLLEWYDTDLTMINAISHRVTGFSADYARNRVGQMRLEHFPERFPGSPISQSSFPSFLILPILSFLIML